MTFRCPPWAEHFTNFKGKKLSAPVLKAKCSIRRSKLDLPLLSRTSIISPINARNIFDELKVSHFVWTLPSNCSESLDTNYEHRSFSQLFNSIHDIQVDPHLYESVSKEFAGHDAKHTLSWSTRLWWHEVQWSGLSWQLAQFDSHGTHVLSSASKMKESSNKRPQ